MSSFIYMIRIWPFFNGSRLENDHCVPIRQCHILWVRPLDRTHTLTHSNEPISAPSVFTVSFAAPDSENSNMGILDV